MGCDIHGYIEYTNKDQENKYWNCLSELHIGRDYTLFGALAGVRDDSIKHIEPKGLPSPTSFWVTLKDNVYVLDDSETLDEGSTKRSTADRWVEQGLSHYNANKTHVSNPDHHSHSWLSLKELEEAAVEYGKHYNNPELEAIIACMRSLNESGKVSRFVFWFDN